MLVCSDYIKVYIVYAVTVELWLSMQLNRTSPSVIREEKLQGIKWYKQKKIVLFRK